MTSSSAAVPLYWEASPERKQSSNLEKFRKQANARYGLNLQTYDDLHAFSVQQVEQFWSLLWDFTGVRCSVKPIKVLSDINAKPADLPRWFPGARLSLAENLLFPIHPSNATSCNGQNPRSWPPADATAILEVNEETNTNVSGSVGDKLGNVVTWGQLRELVSVLAAALRARGIQKGDRVAFVCANTSRPIVVFLAVASIGAIFSSIATDAGTQAICGRLAQIRPRLILTDEAATYAGKRIDLLSRVEEVAAKLASDDADFDVVVFSDKKASSDIEWKPKVKLSTYHELVASVTASGKPPPLRFEPLDFSDPAIICFSSGTTGEPKCIVHGAGGLLISFKREALLQYDIGSTDRYLQVTTTGWIMWVLQLAFLSIGNPIVTYDGAPVHPVKGALHIPRIISAHGAIKGFGVSPRLLTEMQRASEKENMTPDKNLNLKSLILVTTTGAPLGANNAKWFYEHFAPHAQLMSISGGTDLAAAFVGGSVLHKTYGNLISGVGLGFDIRILDPETGEDMVAAGSGGPGELCCVKPFPTQPLWFWGPKGQETQLREKYMDSYYRRYTEGFGKGCWAQADLIVRDMNTGALNLLGRSDNVLNPSGVRFGSAEIYKVMEQFSSWIQESVVVGQRRVGKDEDERVLLFVKLWDTKATRLTEEQRKAVNTTIRKEMSPRHVPAHIFVVKDTPKTANGKLSEMSVKAVVNGNTAFKPSSAIANPAVLDEYRQYADLERVLAQQEREAKL